MKSLYGASASDRGRSDFEFESIREFAHSGLQLGASVSREERRERIRVAILRENKQGRRWRDTGLTYAAVYQRVYGKPIDERRPGEEEITPMLAMRTRFEDYDASVAEDPDAVNADESS